MFDSSGIKDGLTAKGNSKSVAEIQRGGVSFFEQSQSKAFNLFEVNAYPLTQKLASLNLQQVEERCL